MADIELRTATKRVTRKALTFTSGDRKFTFKPGKTGAITAAIVGDEGAEYVRSQLDWLYNGLSKKDEDHLKERLRDLNDPLDIGDLIVLVQQLMAEAAGRPTESSSGS